MNVQDESKHTLSVDVTCSVLPFRVAGGPVFKFAAADLPSIVRDLAPGIVAMAPKAFVLVISNPVNSAVRIVQETWIQEMQVQADIVTALRRRNFGRCSGLDLRIRGSWRPLTLHFCHFRCRRRTR